MCQSGEGEDKCQTLAGTLRIGRARSSIRSEQRTHNPLVAGSSPAGPTSMSIRAFYDQWPQYNQRLIDVVVEMSPEQLVLRPDVDTCPRVGHRCSHCRGTCLLVVRCPRRARSGNDAISRSTRRWLGGRRGQTARCPRAGHRARDDLASRGRLSRTMDPGNADRDIRADEARCAADALENFSAPTTFQSRCLSLRRIVTDAWSGRTASDRPLGPGRARPGTWSIRVAIGWAANTVSDCTLSQDPAIMSETRDGK